MPPDTKRAAVLSGGIIPKEGERALIVGATGSGKTAFATYLLQRVNNVPIVIYDTKTEPKFEALPNSTIVVDDDALYAALEAAEVEYIIYRPDEETVADPDALDNLLMQHYQHLQHTDAYIDELYSFHRGGRSGPGLQALLTRGRSRGISLIMSTQRPSWISKFTMSEANRYYIFRLAMKDDAKSIAGIIPDFDKLPRLPDYHFYYWAHGMDDAIRFDPVPLATGVQSGYTDQAQTATGEAQSPSPVRKRSFFWLT